jgi:hypothetical protein
MSKTKLTYRQLAEAIANMPEELKERQVITWPSDDSEKGHSVTEAEVLKENYRFDGDEGCIEESILKETYDDWNDEDNYIIHPKGMLILITE